MTRHILVISQYFYPEQFRVNNLCAEWVERGYKVTVITGIPNYPQGRFFEGYGCFRNREELFKGIRIKRIPLLPRGNNALMLTLNYLSFVLSGFWWSIFTRIKADCVFIYEVSPMTQALPGIWFARRRKIPCYLYVTDLWPENVVSVSGLKNRFIINALQAMVDYIYKRCDRIFTASASFVDAIKTRQISGDKIEFWPQYAEDCYAPLDRRTVSVPEIPQDGVFNIIFAGNIGAAQGLEILPEAAIILKKRNAGVRFNIVGEGRFRESLIKLVDSKGLTSMFNLVPRQPSSRIPAFMAVCDAALICLAKSKVFSITLPAKVQSCLACGIPILVSGDGEVQEVIKTAQAGLCSRAGDAEDLADIIMEMMAMSEDELSLMARNAVRFSRENYNKDKLLACMDQYLAAHTDRIGVG